MRLPTLTLPFAPGEYAFLQLPRRLTESEFAYVIYLLDVMKPGLLEPPIADEETEPIVEHFAEVA